MESKRKQTKTKEKRDEKLIRTKVTLKKNINLFEFATQEETEQV